MQTKNLPGSSSEYWDEADKQAIVVRDEAAPTQFVRRGRYAVSIDTPYELAIALDWERFDVVDGFIVVK